MADNCAALYKKHNETWWLNKRVVLLRDIQNGYFRWPAGFILKITRKYMGFTLCEIEPCPTCGKTRTYEVSRVSPGSVALVASAEAERGQA